MSESKISCPHCAQHIALDAAWAGQTINCPACQKPFVIPGAAATASPSVPPLRMERAATPPPPPPPPISAGRPGAATPAGAGVQKTSGLAIASLVLSLLGCFVVTAIAGVICGHIARRRIRNNPALGGAGLALAGLIIGYVLLVISIAWWTVFTIVFVKRFNEARHQTRLGGRSFPGIMTNFPSSPRGGVFSSKDEPKLPVPEGAVSGSISGQPFTYTKSALNKAMTMLTISEGEEFFADREVKIFLFLKPNESVENRTWKINAARTGMNPHVHLSWKEGEQNTVPKTEIISSGYQLELKTGAITNDTITGSISLKVTGKTPAELKGNFNAVVE